MMDAATVVLGGIVVSVVSVATGKYLASNGKMTDTHCSERQISCQNLVITKLDSLTDKVDKLTKIVNGKVLGI